MTLNNGSLATVGSCVINLLFRMKKGLFLFVKVPDSTHVTEEDNDKSSRSRITMITPTQLDVLSSKLTDWKKLAAKLGYKPDEIEFFESENATDAARAKNMLRLWFDDDEDASVENLLYIMEGLKMQEACDALRNAK